MRYLDTLFDGVISGIILTISLPGLKYLPLNKNLLLLPFLKFLSSLYLLSTKFSQKILGINIFQKGTSTLLDTTAIQSSEEKTSYTITGMALLISKNYKDILSEPRPVGYSISQGDKLIEYFIKFSGLVGGAIIFNYLNVTQKNHVEDIITIGSGVWFIADCYIHFKEHNTCNKPL